MDIFPDHFFFVPETNDLLPFVIGISYPYEYSYKKIEISDIPQAEMDTLQNWLEMSCRGNASFGRMLEFIPLTAKKNLDKLNELFRVKVLEGSAVSNHGSHFAGSIFYLLRFSPNVELACNLDILIRHHTELDYYQSTSDFVAIK